MTERLGVDTLRLANPLDGPGVEAVERECAISCHGEALREISLLVIEFDITVAVAVVVVAVVVVRMGGEGRAQAAGEEDCLLLSGVTDMVG